MTIDASAVATEVGEKLNAKLVKQSEVLKEAIEDIDALNVTKQLTKLLTSLQNRITETAVKITDKDNYQLKAKTNSRRRRAFRRRTNHCRRFKRKRYSTPFLIWRRHQLQRPFFYEAILSICVKATRIS